MSALNYPVPPRTCGQILITDDDSDLRWVLGATLAALGFGVVASSNGEQALLEVQTRRFDAVLLDVNMPGIGGIETCRRMRTKDPLLPILMLTVRDGELDKIEAFDAGADDYITKPFSVPEVAARLRSAVRRSNAEPRESLTPIVIGEIELDPSLRIVRKGGTRLRLTPKEFELLHYLMKHRGKPIAHSAILQAVWGDDCALQTEYLRTFVSQLRKKLEDDPSEPHYLLTELSFGYRFCDSK
jgi:two-component system, OmpR family, KDP operon response regulator KdpE